HRLADRARGLGHQRPPVALASADPTARAAAQIGSASAACILSFSCLDRVLANDRPRTPRPPAATGRQDALSLAGSWSARLHQMLDVLAQGSLVREVVHERAKLPATLLVDLPR